MEKNTIFSIGSSDLVLEYYVSDKYQASTMFTNAYNEARDQIGYLINSGQLALSPPAIRSKLKELTLENINAPGTTFSSGPCSGDIAKNIADYGC